MRSLVLLLLCLLIAAASPAPPPPFVETMNHNLVADPRFTWHGPATAAGVFVWGHGKGGSVDYRGQPPDEYARVFNDAAWDVVRFERAPVADDRDRAAGWLRDDLARLRAMGYRRIIAAGQSRGAWNALQALSSPGLADVVIAVVPAAQGSGSSPNLGSQTDEFRRLLSDAAPQPATRVALIQFSYDFFMGDGDARARMMRDILRPKVGAVLLIDRPEGFSGHGGAHGPAFATKFGPCLLRFATDPVAPASC